MKIIYSTLVYFLIPSLSISQDFSISKIQSGNPKTNHALIYALPRTGLNVTLEITRIVIKKGPYAEYAQKYLGLTNVPMSDSEIWLLSDAKCEVMDEPDPENYYGLYFKTLPDNLNLLLSLDKKGILLNVSEPSGKFNPPYGNKNDNIIFDPCLINDIFKEQTDTLYKTLITDTSFVRIPVFKKQILAKTQEELVKETAQELIKTRKRRLKYVRGEYDFHPDAATIRIMIDEMEKQEEKYLALFRGIKIEQKFKYRFNIFPTKDLSNIELGYLNKEKGFSKQFMAKSLCFTLQFIKSDTQVLPNSQLDNKSSHQNTLIYRVPSIIIVSLMSNQDEIFKMRVPFYQFGPIQSIPLKLK